jgi:hypothetical protein
VQFAVVSLQTRISQHAFALNVAMKCVSRVIWGAELSVLIARIKMTNLTALCLCVLLWSSCPEPVPRKLFDAVSENTGVAFDYDNQTHQDTVRELLRETFRGGK